MFLMSPSSLSYVGSLVAFTNALFFSDPVGSGQDPKIERGIPPSPPLFSDFFQTRRVSDRFGQIVVYIKMPHSPAKSPQKKKGQNLEARLRKQASAAASLLDTGYRYGGRDMMYKIDDDLQEIIYFVRFHFDEKVEPISVDECEKHVEEHSLSLIHI